ncbi:Hypothetical predicted protein [Cloeon dipterum]|uniref:Sulfur globule protein CV3 n=1 Tax=Cloeon dipterum TaxID=197152 RepID=A0A8S1DAX6_9INSE|nr:Hypothetical predicted protein [Cloeon dipterum]
MYKLMILVLALVAVAASQYISPYAYGGYNAYNGAYRGAYASPYVAGVAATPYAYSNLGYRAGYPAYSYLG